MAALAAADRLWREGRLELNVTTGPDGIGRRTAPPVVNRATMPDASDRPSRLKIEGLTTIV